MKLSVAMCTYNGGALLREQLASIAAQTRPPDELVICDDCSTDETIQIIDSFRASASFDVHLHVNESTLGSTKNFERAASLCTGDLVFFSDQDDVWAPEKLARLVQEFEKQPSAGLLFSDGDVVDEKLQPLGRSVWELIRFGEREQNDFRRGRAFEVLLDHNVATGSALGFRTKFKQLIIPIPGGLIHDGMPVLHDWWAALMVAAVSDVSFVAERLFKYRQHAAQQLGVLSSIREDGPQTETTLAAARRRNSFEGEIEYLRAIRNRLAGCIEGKIHSGTMERLNAQLAHLETRAQLPPSRFKRVPVVFGELLRRRYHLYSNGFSSALKDLLQFAA